VCRSDMANEEFNLQLSRFQSTKATPQRYGNATVCSRSCTGAAGGIAYWVMHSEFEATCDVPATALRV